MGRGLDSVEAHLDVLSTVADTLGKEGFLTQT
jgi:hypothetical protein